MPALAMGPILYNWPVDAWRDFYFRLADETAVDTVYLGEVVCAKRAPLFAPVVEAVADRLTRAGKQVVRATLAQVATTVDRQLIAAATEPGGPMIEVNDTSALYHLGGRPFIAGPFLNVYNEGALAFLAEQGAAHVVLPAELPAASIAAMGRHADRLGVALEVQVYGRIPLAISARCYHARAHGRMKDNCRFVCDGDPDGMVLKTLDDRPFLIVNGIQTLSHACLNLVHELDDLAAAGVTTFRLSPQSCDMVAVAAVFRAVADGLLDAAEADDRLARIWPDAPFANGFYHQSEGHRWMPQPSSKPQEVRQAAAAS